VITGEQWLGIAGTPALRSDARVTWALPREARLPGLPRQPKLRAGTPPRHQTADEVFLDAVDAVVPAAHERIEENSEARIWRRPRKHPILESASRIRRTRAPDHRRQLGAASAELSGRWKP